MTIRQIVAAGVCCIWPGSAMRAQQAEIGTVPAAAPAIVRPYLAPEAPPVRLANSKRLAELVRAGTLYLTAQDAIALALENNIDLEVARYNPLVSQWNVTRAQAGGALPGVPSNASQAGSVANGQGVAGSQAAAGVKILGTGSNRTSTTNASIQQIGPVTQTLDPIIQESSTISHATTLEPDLQQSGTPVLVQSTRADSVTYQQGTLTGGSVTLQYTSNYLNENATSDFLNPLTATSLSLSVQHNLLQGFGVAVNSRIITVAKINVGVSDLTFRTQVINIVAQVLNAYYNLEAAYEDLKAKRNAAETADTFVSNVKQQVQIGSLAEYDIINADSQVVTSRQAVVDSETSLRQQENQLKNLISRTGTADPVLAAVRIQPVDPISPPEQDDLPPLEALVRQSLADRADLAAESQNEKASEVTTLGTKNGVLPQLGVFGGESQSGLAGTAHTVYFDGIPFTPLPYFVGGLGNSLGQTFRRDFPTDRAGAFLFAQFRNRQAQADYAIDQLQYRQTQLSTEKDRNQVQVDVLNNMIALRQARARYDAAVQNRKLQEELLSAEQKRFNLGASIPYNVIQIQRDLTAGQSTEVATKVAYSNARIALERTLGNILTAHHVSIEEARSGLVAR